MTGSQLHRMLAAVLPSAATEALLPPLNAVHLETGPAGAYAVATDRYTLAVARHADPSPRRDCAQITIPRAAALTMLKLTRRRDPVAALRISGGQATVRIAGGITYKTPGIDARYRYPDWRRLLRGLLAAPDAPAGQPLDLNPAYLARFAAAAADLHVSIRQIPGQRCRTLVITAGDWFAGALMAKAETGRATAGPGGWLADLSPVRAA
jgi:hypothetical protein